MLVEMEWSISWLIFYLHWITLSILQGVRCCCLFVSVCVCVCFIFFLFYSIFTVFLLLRERTNERVSNSNSITTYTLKHPNNNNNNKKYGLNRCLFIIHIFLPLYYSHHQLYHSTFYLFTFEWNIVYNINIRSFLKPLLYKTRYKRT